MRTSIGLAINVRSLLLWSSLLVLALLAACGGGGTDAPETPAPPPTPKPVATVAVTLGNSSVLVGATTSASAETRDATGNVLSGRTISWTSSQSGVASVSAAGQVTAIAAGTTNIIATSEGQTGSATLTVAPIPVASIVLSTDSTDVNIRSTVTLQAVTRDAAGQTLAGRVVAWQSSAPTTASVSATGVVSMLLPGTVTITATSEGRSATARVRGTVGSLNAIVDSMRLAREMPAMGAVLLSREGIVAIGVGGNRRMTGGQPVTVNDKWHLGSDTKAITGMLAGIGVEAGVLSWERTIEQAFPDLAGVTRVEYKTVTLKELLSHVSGMVNTNSGLTGSTNLPAARTAWMNYSLQQPPVNARGTYYYSNNGFGAAGAIIERAWNSTYESLIATRILQPLGVTNVGWGPTTTAGGMDQPVGHRRVNNAWQPCEACDNPPGLSSAGTMHASLASWARITQELMLADQGRSTLLTQTTARFLTTNAVPTGGGDPYALGWAVLSNPSGRTVTHDGSNTTNHARVTVFLDTGVAILLTVNASDGDNLARNALTALHNRLVTYYNTGR